MIQISLLFARLQYRLEYVFNYRKTTTTKGETAFQECHLVLERRCRRAGQHPLLHAQGQGYGLGADARVDG